MRRRAGVVLTILLGTGLLSSPFAAAQPPPLPIESIGACPYECCPVGWWTAHAPTLFRQEHRATAPVVFRAEAGDQVQGVSSVLITRELGRTQAKKSAEIDTGHRRLVVPAGATVYVLYPLGEGLAIVWYQGQVLDAEVPPAPHSDPTRPPSETAEFRTESDPEIEWWVAVEERGSGQIGWTNTPERLDHIEACR